MILQVATIICGFFTFIYLYLRFRPLRLQLNRLPHEPEGNLILGNVSLFDWKNKKISSGRKIMFDARMTFSCEKYQKHGIIVYWVGPVPLVVFIQTVYVEQLLSSNVQIDKGFQYNFLHNWLGTGLLTSSGDKWRTRRKMLTPSFHFQILENFIPIMNHKTDILHEVIDKELTQNDGHVLNISVIFLMCALDIICESAMGCDIGAQRNPSSSYVKAIHDISSAFLNRGTNPFLHPDIIYCFTQTCNDERKSLQILHKFTNQVIMRRKKEIKLMIDQGINPETEDDMGRKRKLAFMDSLITEHLKNPSFTQEHIREEVDTFMFEGHDTTAWAMTYTTFLLGHHQEIQAKVHEEMDTIFGSDRDRDITMDDLREMRYLEMCIKEALRLFPSVPLVIRKLNEDMVVTVNGEQVTIPSGVEVSIMIFELHRNPYLWPEPDKFDPERFNPENCKNRNPFSYIPFSAGPRNCIGQKFAILEEKAVLASIFRRFKVTSLVSERYVLSRLNPAVILKTKVPLKTKFESRK